MRLTRPNLTELDRRVAQARIILSLSVLLSMYVDPSTGGLFDITEWQLIMLLCHLMYGSLTYLALSRGFHIGSVRRLSNVFDLLFATAIAFVTEGRTSPSFVLFVFAMVAVGVGTRFRDTLMTTSCAVGLYILVIAVSHGLTSGYLMRAVYLAIAGFLIGFFGQERVNVETRLRELEAEAEREAIARSLHDGYIQALAGFSLRLESCRDMLHSSQPEEALAEIEEMQIGVGHEYDEVRKYVRSLTHHGEQQNVRERISNLNTQFRIQVAFCAQAPIIEHIIQIILEGIRNTLHHGQARVAAINVQQIGEAIRITIDDDGIGFADLINPPWTIASRVAESGGELAIGSDTSGAHIVISIPTK